MITMSMVSKAMKTPNFKGKIKKQLKEAEKQMHELYQQTVETWDTEIRFVGEVSEEGDILYAAVYTGQKEYAWVHEGTKPHKIKPKKPGGVLAFAGTYTAKTVPGVIQSRQGGPQGDMIFTKEVNHPGTKGRNFTEAIKKQFQPIFTQLMEQAIREALKK